MLKRDPDRVAQKEAAKAERERQKAEEVWWASPPGQARAARHHGRKVLQLAVPLESTARTALAQFTGDSTASGLKRTYQDASGTIEQVEAEGWKLSHAGYVFRETGSVSRDKLLSSGQTASVTGEIVGIYIFHVDPDYSSPA